MEKEKNKIIHKAYTVSYQDLVDIWIESLHPDENVVVIWDARRHYENLKEIGFNLSEASLYDNKILTIHADNILGAFEVADLISSIKEPPFVQVYSNGSLLSDNIDL